MSDGIRPLRYSVLPVAEHCGYADTLLRQYPESSTAAEGGTEGHKKLEAAVLRANSGEDPGNEFGPVLFSLRPYKKLESETEVPSIIDPDTMSPMTKPGRADLVVTVDEASLMVGDYKTGLPGRVDPARDNLQVNGYGVSLAILRGAKKYRPFIYFRDGGFDWGDWVKESEYDEVIERIRDSWLRDQSRPVVGQHCDKCFARKHCYAYMLPAHEGPTALEPFTKQGGLSKETAPRGLQAYMAMKSALDVIKPLLEDYAIANDGIEVDGKKWGPRTCHGRRTISVEAVDEAGMLGELEEKGLVRDGHPYIQFGWSNAVKKKK